MATVQIPNRLLDQASVLSAALDISTNDFIANAVYGEILRQTEINGWEERVDIYIRNHNISLRAIFREIRQHQADLRRLQED